MANFHTNNKYGVKTEKILSAFLIILLTSISCNRSINEYLGQGTKMDEEQAFKWMEKGYENGYEPAKDFLD